MEIRANSRDHRKLAKLQNQLGIPLALDENMQIPVIMYKDPGGELKEYLRGFRAIRNYLKHGYNRITRNCPYRHRKCIGEKCALYFVDNGTGDCVLIWQMFKYHERQSI